MDTCRGMTRKGAPCKLDADADGFCPFHKPDGGEVTGPIDVAGDPPAGSPVSRWRRWRLGRAGAAAGAAVVLLAACGGSPSPAAHVQAAFSGSGHAAHSVQQGKDQIAAAKVFCRLLTKGTWTYRQAVTAAIPSLGSRSKATTFVDAAITSYCPGVKR